MEINKIYNEDCLEGMKRIADGSIDMILCDLPYGTTQCKRDTVIDFKKLWDQYERIIKAKGAIVLTATQPFTSALVMSNPKLFKYIWVWDKCRVGGFTSAKLKPLKMFEDICVFSKGKTANCNDNNMKYYPQGLIKVNKISRSSNDISATGYARPSQTKYYVQEFTNYPKQLLTFKLDKTRLHPTQKPVALFEYLIKTYTNPGELVLDNCIGSGTTAIACMNTQRNFIGFEMDKGYYDIACNRIEKLKKPGEF